MATRTAARRTISTTTLVILGLVVVLALAAAIFIAVRLSRQGPSSRLPPVTRGSATEARAVLDRLPVAPAASMAGYSRERFHHWSRAEKFGWTPPRSDCTTREAALVRDGQDVRVGDRCTILSGAWLDPYTGQTFTKPADVDIDHVVPLAAAWRAGASKWNDARREQYANDPQVLLTVEDNANQEKGDKGPEAWKPPRREEWCDYAQRWITIKAKYGLAVIAPAQGGQVSEKAALQDMLNTCGGR